MKYDKGSGFAKRMDENDSLSSFREKFHFPKQESGKDVIYFCGNSLGLQPKSTRSFIEEELKNWEALGVEGHFRAGHPWKSYHETLSVPMARIVGAKPEEVVAMNTLTVNLHLMLVSFYRPTLQRHKILMEGTSFPSDLYAIKSQMMLHGYDPSDSLIQLQPREGETHIRTEDIEALIEREGYGIALILIGNVNYYSGQAFDMQRITSAGHRKGCVVGFDLAHAAGNMEMQLHDWDVDFAVWCTYKYLNSGPGGIAGCFVHEKYAGAHLPRLSGWWGVDAEQRFLMTPEFNSSPGAAGWQLSTAQVLPMASLRASLQIFDEAGMKALRKKSKQLTGYLEYLIGSIDHDHISIITPREPDQRGCQLSLRVKNRDKRIFEKIYSRGVIADWREPDVIRVAPVPLYNSFTDVFEFSEILRDELQKKAG